MRRATSSVRRRLRASPRLQKRTFRRLAATARISRIILRIGIVSLDPIAPDSRPSYRWRTSGLDQQVRRGEARLIAGDPSWRRNLDPVKPPGVEAIKNPLHRRALFVQ